MAEPVSDRPTPYSNADTGVKPDRGSPPGTPRWVKVFAIIALALVVLLVILHLTGRGFGGHAPSGGYMPPSIVIESIVQWL
jgi:hypothetical protein